MSYCDCPFPQKFENRQSVVWETEAKYWADLTMEYMTEESDCSSDDNCIVEHKVPWRSKGKGAKVAIFRLLGSYLYMQTLMISLKNLMRGTRGKLQPREERLLEK